MTNKIKNNFLKTINLCKHKNKIFKWNFGEKKCIFNHKIKRSI